MKAFIDGLPDETSVSKQELLNAAGNELSNRSDARLLLRWAKNQQALVWNGNNEPPEDFDPFSFGGYDKDADE
jgi:hypothetical protein